MSGATRRHAPIDGRPTRVLAQPPASHTPIHTFSLRDPRVVPPPKSDEPGNLLQTVVWAPVTRPIVIVLTARTTAKYGVWVEDVELAPAALIRTLQQAGLLVLLVARDSIGDQAIEQAVPGVDGIVAYADDELEGTTGPSPEVLEAAYSRPVLRVGGAGEIAPGELARFLERLSA
jgi:hypothetical protein